MSQNHVELPNNFIKDILKLVDESSSPRSVMVPDQTHLVQKYVDEFLHSVLQKTMVMTGHIDRMKIRKSEVDYALNMFAKEKIQSEIVHYYVQDEEEDEEFLEGDKISDHESPHDVDDDVSSDHPSEKESDLDTEFDKVYPTLQKKDWNDENVFQGILRPTAVEMSRCDLRWDRDAYTRMNRAMQSYVVHQVKNSSHV